MTATLTRVSQVDVHDPRVDPAPDGWAAFRARCLPPGWDCELLRREAWLAKNPPVLAAVREGDRVVGPRWAEVYLPLLSGYPACVFDEEFGERRPALRRFEREAARCTTGPRCRARPGAGRGTMSTVTPAAWRT